MSETHAENAAPPPYRAVVFDLDGTLADTLETIGRVANRALAQLGLAEHPIEAYRQFVGDGVAALCERILPEDARDRHEELMQALRRLYEDHRSDGAQLYPGVLALLDELATRGALLGVLSNKPDDLTHGTLEDLGVADRFQCILGQRDDLERKPSPAGARWVCGRLGVTADEVLYVGDTPTDMQTALAAGFTAVGVSWGFRPREELAEHGARHLVDEASQILALYDQSASGRADGPATTC